MTDESTLWGRGSQYQGRARERGVVDHERADEIDCHIMRTAVVLPWRTPHVETRYDTKPRLRVLYGVGSTRPHASIWDKQQALLEFGMVKDGGYRVHDRPRSTLTHPDFQSNSSSLIRTGEYPKSLGRLLFPAGPPFTAFIHRMVGASLPRR